MRKFVRHGAKALLAGVAASVLFSPAFAEPMSGNGISVRAGAGNHYQRYEMAWESPSFYTYQFESNNSRLDLLAEVSGSLWRASGSREPSSMWQLGAAPFVRWSVNNAFYFEAGLSANVFSRSRFADKDMSTKFQFGEHVGFGAYLGDDTRLGLRYSHFSNAGIKRPNPGLDVFQVLLSHQF
ncbi:acyloxyacyl hydrolase [Pusillimonas sp. NJUB218]|uniref:acyloxyacyl hydrolase n=1 Tax=Pusillimonas sp. NJUB218 TaxID=2023230 RepID=UPI000F4C335E|nr:acyloxyacyl hydrolase [Pusillimonas sp. NJUB218]ROT46533.1 hypothetical protein CHR62_00935 [Pusillimonas sp. NJUB218]